MRPKAVLFDCDGVLVDSEPASRCVIAERLRNAGLTLKDRELSELFLGGTLANLAKAARSRGADIPPEWVEETYAAMFAVLAGVDPVPGVHALLDALDSAKISYAVCSNGPMRKMEITLGATNLWHRFEDRVFSAHVHGPPKPAPDLYLQACRALATLPSDCVVVEDSPTGARAARAAGIPCLGLAQPEDADAVHKEGARIIAALHEVEHFVLG